MFKFSSKLLMIASCFAATLYASRTLVTSPISWDHWIHWTSISSNAPSAGGYWHQISVSLTNAANRSQSGRITFLVDSQTDYLNITSSGTSSLKAAGLVWLRILNPFNQFDVAGEYAPITLAASSASREVDFSLPSPDSSVKKIFLVQLTGPLPSGAANATGIVRIKIVVNEDMGAIAGVIGHSALVSGNVNMNNGTYQDWRQEVTNAAYNLNQIAINSGRPF